MLKIREIIRIYDQDLIREHGAMIGIATMIKVQISTDTAYMEGNLDGKLKYQTKRIEICAN
jgi:hypothetical protein